MRAAVPPTRGGAEAVAGAVAKQRTEFLCKILFRTLSSVIPSPLAWRRARSMNLPRKISLETPDSSWYVPKINGGAVFVMAMRRKRLVLSMLALCLVGAAGIEYMRSRLQASIVLLAESEISEVELSFDRYRSLETFAGQPTGERMFAWDGVLAEGPQLRMTWRGPDGRQHKVEERVLQQSYEPRCIHIIRLNAEAEPILVRQFYDGSPAFVDTACR